jgi:pre-mRNA-processing factor 17
VYTNPTAQELWQPAPGPAVPGEGSSAVPRNLPTGLAQRVHFDEATFHDQYHTFQSFGYAQDPSQARSQVMVGSAEAAISHGGKSAVEMPRRRGRARGEKRNLDPADVEGFRGSWAASWLSALAPTPSEAVDGLRGKGEAKDEAEAREDRGEGVAEPESADDREVARQLGGKRGRAEGDVPTMTAAAVEGKEGAERTVLHVEELDYQGRSYMHCPGEHDHAPPSECHLPQRCVYTYGGHNKGVSALRFLPRTGHLLLSVSMDSTIKIWGVWPPSRRCLRTIYGHAAAIKDVSFNADGSQFVTTSFDRFVKLWDTETGKCISRHSTGKVANCVRMHTGNGKECLAGQADRAIVQWDLVGNVVAQKYEEHLAAVNTVTLIDDNRRFVSTSDDRKCLVWEYGMAAVIKHIAEPEMHAVASVSVHPNGKWWAGQSMDNQIVVYSARDGFKPHKRKRFKGHMTAGYACQVGFSCAGDLVISGDGEGRCFIWSWQTGRLLSKLQCHKKVAIGCEWHPLEPSTLATCSWDGTIKLWQ